MSEYINRFPRATKVMQESVFKLISFHPFLSANVSKDLTIIRLGAYHFSVKPSAEVRE